MNAARVAALHLELARIHGELARELGAGDDRAPAQLDAPPPRGNVPPRRKPRPFAAPLGEVSELDRARAAKMLARRGIGR